MLIGRDIPSIGTDFEPKSPLRAELTCRRRHSYVGGSSAPRATTAIERPMAGLQSAQTRLDSAVTRLEQAYDAYRRKLALQPAAAAAARAAVTGDQVGPDIDSLIRSLESTQKENTELNDLAETIGDRLDKTIGRLQTVISGITLKNADAAQAGDDQPDTTPDSDSESDQGEGDEK